MNVSALIGNEVSTLVTAAQKYNIPYFFMSPSKNRNLATPNSVVSLFPKPEFVIDMIADTLTSYTWNEITVLYHDMEGR